MAKLKSDNKSSNLKELKRNKYGNVKIVNEYGKFDSQREYERYLVLMYEERSGIISNLRRQVKYILIPEIKETFEVQLKTKIKYVEKTVQQAITYSADFVYTRNGVEVVEDVKISKFLLPKEYTLKKKMFRYFYGFNITEYYG